jgi:hypothetical protein
MDMLVNIATLIGSLLYNSMGCWLAIGQLGGLHVLYDTW